MGFRVTETMRGWHELRDGPGGRLPFEFSARWGPDRFSEWIDPRKPTFLWQELDGEVSAGGLCNRAPCHGTLHLRYFPDRAIRYDFDFDADGVGYHYSGEKVNLLPWNLLVSHTTCYGVVTARATGRLVSTGVTLFRLRDLPSFLNIEVLQEPR